jgi:hypothetical protein
VDERGFELAAMGTRVRARGAKAKGGSQWGLRREGWKAGLDEPSWGLSRAQAVRRSAPGREGSGDHRGRANRLAGRLQWAAQGIARAPWHNAPGWAS